MEQDVSQLDRKRALLSEVVAHIDVTSFDARPILDGYRHTAFQARNLAEAADIYSEMLADRDCAVILTLAGSLVSAGLKEAIVTLIENDMADVVVSSGANIVDQDFFEALGFRHYMAPGTPEAPVVSDEELQRLGIDRIYDTFIDEAELRECDDTMRRLFDSMEPGAYSSRELVREMGRYLHRERPGARSIVLSAYRKRVPIFVPAFSDCSAGFGIVAHQAHAAARGEPWVAFDSGKDFHELTRIKLDVRDTGLIMVGGGVPKNFAQDAVVAAEILIEEGLGGSEVREAALHKYAVQLTVADSRDGGLSGSTLREACSWGKVATTRERMVFGEATVTLPLLLSDAYHRRAWTSRREMRLSERLDAWEPAGVANAAPQPV
jgi:deoxyhypusine synthase